MEVCCQLFFWNLTHFFDVQINNTSNLILLSFKVPSKSFFHKFFKTDLFEICGFKNCKIGSKVVNISVHHIGIRFLWMFIFFFRRNCDPLFQLLNNTLKLEESIPDYYNGQVLLRSSPNYPQTFSGELRFQTLFHIIVIWMSVFIGLSKGLKSYGKVVYIFSIASLLGFSVFAIKVIGLLPFESFKFWINSTHWLDLLHNGDVSFKRFWGLR